MAMRAHGARARRRLAAWLALAACGLTACGEDATPRARDRKPRGAERFASPADAPGRFLPLPAREPETQAQPERGALPRGDAQRLEAIGYAAGSRVAPERSGVTRSDPDRSWPGVNLLVSGHAPEAVLLDMQGRPLHRWRFAWWGAPRADTQDPGVDALAREQPEFWRRAQLGARGELIALFDGLGLVKLDRESRPIWKLELPVHHDLDSLPDGRIAVLTREPRRVPEIDAERDVLDDGVALLDAQGRLQRRISLLDALAASPFAGLLARREPGRRYVLHTNSVEILDGRLADRLPAFRAGHALVSMLGLDAIAVVDLEAERVVWALTGDFSDQHDPSLLPSGRILLFDNVGLRDASRALELDPVSGRELWSYRGSAAEPFYTRWCGAAQRLPNGNTLLSETDAGRAIEVTPDGRIVWEFWNPERAGARGELIASLFELRRYPPDALGAP